MVVKFFTSLYVAWCFLGPDTTTNIVIWSGIMLHPGARLILTMAALDPPFKTMIIFDHNCLLEAPPPICKWCVCVCVWTPQVRGTPGTCVVTYSTCAATTSAGTPVLATGAFHRWASVETGGAGPTSLHASWTLILWSNKSNCTPFYYLYYYHFHR